MTDGRYATLIVATSVEPTYVSLTTAKYNSVPHPGIVARVE